MCQTPMAGRQRNGSVLKFTPDGVGSVFADTGLQLAFGLAFDRAGNLYVSNNPAARSRSFLPTGLTWVYSPALD